MTFGIETGTLFLLYIPMLVVSDINITNWHCSFLKKENDNTGITEAHSHSTGMLNYGRHIIHTACCVQVKFQHWP